jgi:hypothetical protein
LPVRRPVRLRVLVGLVEGETDEALPSVLPSPEGQVRRHKYDLAGVCACGARLAYGRTKRDRVYFPAGNGAWSTVETPCTRPRDARAADPQVPMFPGAGPVQGPGNRNGTKH